MEQEPRVERNQDQRAEPTHQVHQLAALQPVGVAADLPIQTSMSRRLIPFLLSSFLVVGSTSGCILGSSKAASVIDKVVPKPNQQLACGNTGIDGPKGRMCSWIVTGSEAGVVRRIAAALDAEGYQTACTDSSLGAGGVEVIGSRQGMRVTADVIPSGFAVLTGNDAIFYGPGTQASGQTVQIPSDSVGLQIDASEYASTNLAGDSCSALAE
jgi:hypothetical protein